MRQTLHGGVTSSIAALIILADEADEHGVLKFTDGGLPMRSPAAGEHRRQEKANAMVRAIREQRRMLCDWQAKRDDEGLQNPTLVDYQREYHGGEKKNHSVYRGLPIVDLIRRVNETCGPKTPKEAAQANCPAKSSSSIWTIRSAEAWKKPPGAKEIARVQAKPGLGARRKGLWAAGDGQGRPRSCHHDVIRRSLDERKTKTANWCRSTKLHAQF